MKTKDKIPAKTKKPQPIINTNTNTNTNTNKMAKFIKVEAVSQPQSLIPIAEIAGIAATSAAGDTTLVITLANGTSTWTVVVADPVGGVDAKIESFNKAIVANPGGMVSTVVPPLTTEQVPAPQAGEQGRIVITQPAVYTKFASCVFSA